MAKTVISIEMECERVADAYVDMMCDNADMDEQYPDLPDFDTLEESIEYLSTHVDILEKLSTLEGWLDAEIQEPDFDPELRMTAKDVITLYKEILATRELIEETLKAEEEYKEQVIEDERTVQEVLGLFYKEVPVTLTMQEYADYMHLTLEEVEEPGVIAVVIDPSGKHYVMFKEGNIEERE
jgi:hypothetical protein